MAIRRDEFRPGDVVRYAAGRERDAAEYGFPIAPLRVIAVKKARRDIRSMGHTQLVTVEGKASPFSGAWFEPVRPVTPPAGDPAHE